jgi:hypothetical protein
MKNSLDMVGSAIKELTKQVARDKKWKRSMDERMEKVLDHQESLQRKDREKTMELLEMAMNREAKKEKIPAEKEEGGRKMWNRMRAVNRWVSCGFGNYVTTVVVTRLF